MVADRRSLSRWYFFVFVGFVCLMVPAAAASPASSMPDGPDTSSIIYDYDVEPNHAQLVVLGEGAPNADRIARVFAFRIALSAIDDLYDPSADLVAPSSPRIDPADVANRTPQQVDDLANDAGLTPRGSDPHGGSDANACTPHLHVNDPAGNRLDINGNSVPPESPAAHLPLSTDVPG